MPVKREGAFTISEAGITWQCSRCETTNPLAAQVCSVCGTRFADSVRPAEDRPQRDPNTVALYSLFFPGAGHWYLGQKVAGVARGVLSTWVVLVAVIAGIAGSTLMALVFGVAAMCLWGVAAHDAYREARGETSAVILKSRIFVYVVLGLLLLMFVMLVSAAMRANR
ncbi:MAG: hypothetical protein QOG04_1712 [Actinomycetota bacterium]|jgi:hypothetical protein|nr:hypothetical protein [Actinomycetota bacterium]